MSESSITKLAEKIREFVRLQVPKGPDLPVLLDEGGACVRLTPVVGGFEATWSVLWTWPREKKSEAYSIAKIQDHEVNDWPKVKRRIMDARDELIALEEGRT